MPWRVGPGGATSQLLRVSCVAASSLVIAAGFRSGGASRQHRAIPDAVSPKWFGHNFADSPAAVNPWSAPLPLPEAIIGDLEPTAPLDRMDKGWLDSLTGATPLAPDEHAVGSKRYAAVMRPDWVPRYHRPRTFPADDDPPAAPEKDSPVLPLDEKHVVHKMDRLRPTKGTWEYLKSRMFGPDSSYPLTAPADRVQGELAARGDAIPKRLRRYLEQVHDRGVRLEAFKRLEKLFNTSDQNQDSAVSHEEFESTLRDRQNKSTEEADRLWAKFHTSRGAEMEKGEFERLARIGFDLGAINRTDVTTVLVAPHLAAQGFWGSGAACPSDQLAVGVRLKVMPPSDSVDNTGLNGVGLRCSDGTEVSSIEGPDGAWTEWADCAEGQQVYAYRVQSQARQPVGDNAGITSLGFACRAPDLAAFSRIDFGDGVAAGGVSAGWAPELMCPPRGAVCGLQANVLRDQGEGGDMGITDLRVYCCDAKVDCSKVCASSASVKCAVCRRVLGVVH